MARGHLITPQVEALVASIHRKHPKWKAPTVCTVVRSILRKRNPQSPKNWPSLSAVQKILATVRKGVTETKLQDQPWSMGTLTDDQIPYEAVPAVLNVWKYKVARNESFTIRQAKWAARLSGLPKFDGTYNMRRLRRLAAMSNAYAELEAVYEDAGHSTFDAGVLDRLIMGIPGGGIPVELRDKDTDEAMSAKLVYLFYDDPDDWESEPDRPPTERWESRVDRELDENDWRFRQINMIWEAFKKEAQNER